jgi:myo-inositol-1-phosphate synthase
MPNAIIEDAIVNLPAHLLDDVNAILQTPEYIQQIKDNKCAMSVYTYTDDNGEHRSIKWIDIE